jgi:hypothetical protein
MYFEAVVHEYKIITGDYNADFAWFGGEHAHPVEQIISPIVQKAGNQVARFLDIVIQGVETREFEKRISDGRLLNRRIVDFLMEAPIIIERSPPEIASIKLYDIANMDCGEIRSEHIVALASELLAGGRQPSTVGNYISHLAAIFAIARPAWGYRLDKGQMDDAHAVLRRMGIIGKTSSAENARSARKIG